MKQFFGKDYPIKDGRGGFGLGVEGEDFVLAGTMRYPIAKVIEPATAALDDLLVKLEKIIPGDWDKPLIETLKKEYKEHLMRMLSEKKPADEVPASGTPDSTAGATVAAHAIEPAKV